MDILDGRRAYWAQVQFGEFIFAFAHSKPIAFYDAEQVLACSPVIIFCSAAGSWIIRLESSNIDPDNSVITLNGTEVFWQEYQEQVINLSHFMPKPVQILTVLAGNEEVILQINQANFLQTDCCNGYDISLLGGPSDEV